MIPPELKDFVFNCSTADLIRMHLLIKERYEDVKQSTPNFSAAVWAVINPDRARENNYKQSKVLRAKKAAAKDS
jgi:hypothetical protein